MKPTDFLWALTVLKQAVRCIGYYQMLLVSRCIPSFLEELAPADEENDRCEAQQRSETHDSCHLGRQTVGDTYRVRYTLENNGSETDDT